MLVLKRKPGEAIVLECADGRIVVRLRSENRGDVKFQIEAPASVRILREEMLDKKKEKPE